jgi:hypothetical protein
LPYDRFAPIVLKKSFWGDDQNFSGPLMRFARGDMGDHIVSHKNDHGPSYRPYRALQREERLRIDFREIIGAARFSTFATLSARSGPSLKVGFLIRLVTLAKYCFGRPLIFSLDPTLPPTLRVAEVDFDLRCQQDV